VIEHDKSLMAGFGPKRSRSCFDAVSKPVLTRASVRLIVAARRRTGSPIAGNVKV
jgi:hypothetical protein